MAKLISDKAMNRVVSRLPGVHDEVGDTARRVQRSARRRLDMHRETGKAQVSLTEGKVDWFVNLDDKAAASIEFGHWTETRDGAVYVQGLYVLTRAAGLM